MLVFRLDAQGVQIGRQHPNADGPQPLGRLRPSPDGHYRLNRRLRAVLEPQELTELRSWLAEINALQTRAKEIGDLLDALMLPQELGRAADWFATTEHPQTGFLALRIAAAMQDLQAVMDRLVPPRAEEGQVADEVSAHLPQGEQPAIRGRLDQVLPRRVTGWAMRSNPNEPARIRLLINGLRELKAIADQPRPDVQEHGLHPTGQCGFLIHLAEDEALQAGDEIRAFVVPEGIELANSPLACQDGPKGDPDQGPADLKQ